MSVPHDEALSSSPPHVDSDDTWQGRRPAGSPASSVTLVEGSSFCVSGFDGGIDAQRSDGLFIQDARVVSAWNLVIDGAPVEPLSVTPGEPFECVFVGRATARSGRPEPTLVVERRRLIGLGMREDITIVNYGTETAGIDVTLTVDADFADLFQVKEHRHGAFPMVGHHHAGADLTFWLGQHGARRGVRITASGARAASRQLMFRVVVEPHESWSTTVEVLPSVDSHELASAFPTDRPVASTAPASRMRGWRDAMPEIVVGNPVLGHALAVSERDLGALRIEDPEHPEDDVVAAGAPWFMALFGRDSLLTGHMMLPFAPRLALGTLRTLARFQGEQENLFTDEEPGKILHEVRLGTDLSLALGGESIYYGSIDSTPLFVTLVGRALRWGVSAEDLLPLRAAVERATRWIVEHGDRDGDGFVEYRRGSDRGLENQGWKDSVDSLTTEEGVRAAPPIALAEVQGYCYSAFLARADLDEAWGDSASAVRWRERAAELKRRFHEAFWMPELGFYAMALDHQKRQVGVVSSNIGHCLWSGIVGEEVAGTVIDRLLEPDMFTGFGIRTRSSASVAFNPVSYHNGSVWPHDTVLCAAGMAAYGRADAAQRVVAGLLDAMEAFGGRLPELFCGFDRAEKPLPVPYPTSCSPQAWAAATPFEVLRICLDLDVDVPRGLVSVSDPSAVIGAVGISRLPLGDSRVRVEAGADGAHLDGLPPGLRLSSGDAVQPPRDAVRTRP